MALDAVFGLLSLGLKGADVVALVMTGMPQGMFCDWFVYFFSYMSCVLRKCSLHMRKQRSRSAEQ